MTSESQISEDIVGSDCVLFLGAGASAPLGLHPTAQFLQLLIERLPNLINEAKGNAPGPGAFTALFAQAGATYGVAQPDVEIVLDYIDHLVQTFGRLKELPQEFSQLADTAGVPTLHQQWETMMLMLRTNIERVVVEHYSTVSGKAALQLYNSLLEAWASQQMIMPVFTTNYDWTFEHLIQEADGRFQLLDGFRTDSFGLRWARSVFDELALTEQRNVIVMFKLHGSTLWHRDANDSNLIRKSATASSQRGDAAPILIYPTQVKAEAVQTEPFRTAYEYFHECLRRCKLCIVIGFSFRDPSVNEVIAQALVANDDLKLAIVDPAINQPGGIPFATLLSRLGLTQDTWHERIRAIVGKFGEDEYVNTSLIETVNNLKGWEGLEHWVS